MMHLVGMFGLVSTFILCAVLMITVPHGGPFEFWRKLKLFVNWRVYGK